MDLICLVRNRLSLVLRIVYIVAFILSRAGRTDMQRNVCHASFLIMDHELVNLRCGAFIEAVGCRRRVDEDTADLVRGCRL